MKKYLLMLALCLLSVVNTSANQDFTSFRHINNVMFVSASWAYSDVSDIGTEIIVSYLIQELLNEMDEHITVCLITNAFLYKQTKTGYVPFKYAIGYINGRSGHWDADRERENIKKPCLQIFYNDPSVKLSDVLLLVYTGLKNRKEIERTQTSFVATSSAEKWARTNEVSSIDEKTIENKMDLYSQEVSSIGYEDIYAIAEFNEFRPLNYYYRNNAFHFYKFKNSSGTSEIKDDPRFSDRFMASLRKYFKTQEYSKSKDLLILDHFQKIMSFGNEFLVFTTDSTFYNISFTRDTSFGPFTVHGFDRFYRETLVCRDQSLHDSAIIINYRGYLKANYDAKFCINYNIYTGNVNSYIPEVDTFGWRKRQQHLASRIRFLKDSLLIVNNRSALQKRTRNLASIMMLALLANTIFIILAVRKAR